MRSPSEDSFDSTCPTVIDKSHWDDCEDCGGCAQLHELDTVDNDVEGTALLVHNSGVILTADSICPTVIDESHWSGVELDKVLADWRIAD